MEAGSCEQSDARVDALLASEVTEDTAGLLDDGHQRGDVPWACSHQEKGIQLTGRDEKATMAGTRSSGRFPWGRRAGFSRRPVEHGAGLRDVGREFRRDGALRRTQPDRRWPDTDRGIVHVAPSSD